MDDVDLIQVQNEFLMKTAIDAARAMATGGAESSEFCEECGVDIPVARRLAVPGCLLCVVCQGEFERGM